MTNFKINNKNKETWIGLSFLLSRTYPVEHETTHNTCFKFEDDEQITGKDVGHLRRTLRELGYKITKWNTCYVSKADDTEATDTLHTDIPFELWKKVSDLRCEWVKSIATECFHNDESDSESEKESEDPSSE